MPLSWCCRDHSWLNQPLQATAKSTPRLSATTLAGATKAEVEWWS